jgi:hypothetical protein
MFFGLNDVAFLAAASAGPGLWTPADITTALWLDAADASTITESGGAVSQWDDKSGNDRNAVQLIAECQPTYVTSSLNGKNGIDWGAISNRKGLFIPEGFASPVVFVVADYDGSDPFNEFASIYAADNPNIYRPIFTANTGTSWLSSSTCALNGASAGSSVALPAISNPFIARNVSVSNLTSRGVTSIGCDIVFVNNDPFAGYSIPRGWRGKIYEIVTLTEAPNTADRQIIEGYLAHKWGLAANLPNDHPYKAAAPTA